MCRLLSLFLFCLVAFLAAGCAQTPEADGIGGRNGIRAKAQQERPIVSYLQWLADHQNEAGYWSPGLYHLDAKRAKFGAAQTHNIEVNQSIGVYDDLGQEHFRNGATALALLGFVGAGHTYDSGEYRKEIKRALRYLMKQQSADGSFGDQQGESFMLNQALCTMAMAEHYAMSGSVKFKDPTRRAKDFLIKAQLPAGGWGYDSPSSKADPILTLWAILALKSVQIGELLDKESMGEIAKSSVAALEEVDEFATPVGAKEDANLVDTIRFVITAMAYPWKERKEAVKNLDQETKARIIGDTPVWASADGETPSHDLTKWYCQTFASFLMGKEEWKQWGQQGLEELLMSKQRGWHPIDQERYGKETAKPPQRRPNQHLGGDRLIDEHGSWDCLGPWSKWGGRVYSTAMGAMILEIYERWERVMGPDDEPAKD